MRWIDPKSVCRFNKSYDIFVRFLREFIPEYPFATLARTPCEK